MKTKWKIMGLAIVSVLLLAAGTAMAGPVGRTQARQQTRIYQGVESGQLTKWEAKALRHQQRMIRETRRAFLCDGHLSRRERAILWSMQDRANHNIARKKHNTFHY